MKALMLEGWTPILLMGIVAAIILFLISRKVSRKVLFSISIVLSLISFGIVIYSKEVVGGWDGIGILYVTITVFLGIWIGTIIGALSKKKST
ncbi:YesK family protein [Virgibacillus sp. FSP13]